MSNGPVPIRRKELELEETVSSKLGRLQQVGFLILWVALNPLFTSAAENTKEL